MLHIARRRVFRPQSIQRRFWRQLSNRGAIGAPKTFVERVTIRGRWLPALRRIRSWAVQDDNVGPEFAHHD
jgi:hypothetical protein